MVPKRWSVGFSYWLVVFLTLFAFLFLGYMANRAIRLEMESHSEQEQAEAVKRAKQAARLFFNELPERLASEPGIPFPPLVASMPILVWPDSSLSQTIFSELAVSQGADREKILEGWLNAEPQEKPLWNLLLAIQSLRTANFSGAHEYLARIRESPFDYRLFSGLTIKSAAILLDSQLYELEKDTDRAEKILFGLGAFPPLQGPVFSWTAWGVARFVQESSWNGFSPEKLTPGKKLLQWSWNTPAERVTRPGWIAFMDETFLLVGRKGAFQAYPGGESLRQLQAVIQQAVGEAGRVLFFPSEHEGRESFEDLAGISFTVKFPEQAGPDILAFSRMKVGFLLGIALVGFAFIVLFGIRREHERNVFSEQDFFYRQAAHDLKTPLTTLKTLAETLSLGRVESPEKRIQYLEKISSEVDHASDVVDSMLMAARLRTGVIKPAPEILEPRRVMGRILERFSPRLEGWALSNNLDSTAQVWADPVMFERVFINLIENVLRHASDGRTLVLESRESPTGKTEIGIGDGGRGYSFPTSSDALQQTGSGLGLFLVETILILHGGSMRREKKAEKFWVVTEWPAGKGGWNS